ncbi:MAG: SLC13 family permease [Pseudomonadota bacterium]
MSEVQTSVVDGDWQEPETQPLRPRIGLVLGPLAAGVLLLLGAPDSLAATVGPSGDPWFAWSVCALLIWMATWWVTEAVPIPVTALLPLVILPVVAGQSVSQTAAPYMHPIVVLLMGGFIVAKAIERWNLHTRIALNVVVRAGARPAALVGGFMAAAALLSMWISNTATAIMLTPIALSVASAVLGPGQDRAPFTMALVLGVAYGCSIGGVGTYIGTPTNLIIVGYLNETTGRDISFLQWMTFGVPTVLVMLPLAWFVLTKWAFKLSGVQSGEGVELVRERLAALGQPSVPEQRTLMVFALVAFLWIFRQPLQAITVAGVSPFGGFTDHVTAILGVVLCFVVPAGCPDRPHAKILDWDAAESIPWGVVILFGGGMSLAVAIRASGLGTWIGNELGILGGLPTVLLVLVLTAFVIFLTEITSNVATAAALMPVLGAFALSIGLDVSLVALPLALAASCAFMLPMATGPNAVVYAESKVSLTDMARAGFRLNLIAIVVVAVLSLALAPVVFS